MCGDVRATNDTKVWLVDVCVVNVSFTTPLDVRESE